MKLLKVLIVEDESIMALQLREAFEKLGHTVIGVAKKGETAIELARIDPPELLIMDISLKGELDGIETAKKIFDAGPMGIIFISAFSGAAFVRRARELPCVQYLVKPVHDEQIRVAVETICADFEHGMTRSKTIALAYGCTYDPETGALEQNGNPIRLTKTEKRLLDCLCKKPGRLVPYQEMEYCVWPERTVNDSTRKNLVYAFNKKFSPSPIELRTGLGLILHLS